ncbi:hypothetical protein CAE01nite_11090 [Cellulomonas aerilata]|uniref:Uncharacterized protein n=1 Tax=Cellulomonas aerilata TaxID=515326 RepID=A0A512DA67_9CELL|nr:hypothetical protein [Cellulomonas aerilata]GEO33384.1 hypothetical protein CAE01nite_11090 [Cellulomonas aerilata]
MRDLARAHGGDATYDLATNSFLVTLPGALAEGAADPAVGGAAATTRHGPGKPATNSAPARLEVSAAG